MNPTLEQLARYVVQELGRGVPEVTLYAALRESGWTQDWINAAFSTAKQRAVPENPGHMQFPTVQTTQRAPHHSTRPHPQQPKLQSPGVTPVRAVTPPRTPQLKKILLIVIAALSVVVVGLGLYRTFNGIQHRAEQRVIQDADRREDLSVLLSNLSDYFVTHKSYPTRTQLNTADFAQENSFSADSITDPKWTIGDEACTKDSKPSLSGVVIPNCYAYEVKAADGGVCNNASTPCTKVKVSIWLEVDKQAYAVTFDKNTQTDN